MAEENESRENSDIASAIFVRTMASDLKAIERSGGQLIHFDAPDFTAYPSAGGEGGVGLSQSVKLESSAAIPDKKTSWIWIAAFLIIAGIMAAILGYFVVFPWIFK